MGATLKPGQKLKYQGPERHDDNRARYDNVESLFAPGNAENTLVKEQRAGFRATKT